MKKHFVATIMLVVILLLLPGIISWGFNTADNGWMKILIFESYTQGEILSYIIAAIAIVIGIVTSHSTLRNQYAYISVDFFIDKSNNGQVVFVIENNSTLDCEIQTIGIENKKIKNSFYSLCNTPFVLKAKSCQKIELSSENIFQLLVFIGQGGIINQRKVKCAGIIQGDSSKNLRIVVTLLHNKKIYCKLNKLLDRLAETDQWK